MPLVTHLSRLADTAEAKLERHEKLTPLENGAFLLRVWEGSDRGSPAMTVGSALSIVGELVAALAAVEIEAISGFRERLLRAVDRLPDHSVFGHEYECNAIERPVDGKWLDEAGYDCPHGMAGTGAVIREAVLGVIRDEPAAIFDEFHETTDAELAAPFEYPNLGYSELPSPNREGGEALMTDPARIARIITRLPRMLTDEPDYSWVPLGDVLVALMDPDAADSAWPGPAPILDTLRELGPLRKALRLLIEVGRDGGACRFCHVPRSTMHDDDCPIEQAIRASEPGYARAITGAVFPVREP